MDMTFLSFPFLSFSFFFFVREEFFHFQKSNTILRALSWSLWIDNPATFVGFLIFG